MFSRQLLQHIACTAYRYSVFGGALAGLCCGGWLGYFNALEDLQQHAFNRRLPSLRLFAHTSFHGALGMALGSLLGLIAPLTLPYYLFGVYLQPLPTAVLPGEVKDR